MINQILNQLIKYISPVRYFFLRPLKNNSYWVDYHKLENSEKKIIDYCTIYDSEGISLIDSAYQLWHKGHIESEDSKRLINNDKRLRLSTQDHYIFTRRMFKPIWSWYTLFMRIITLHNPFNEVYNFMKTIKVNRIDLNRNIYNYDDYNDFFSNNLKDKPKVSIILPTLNRYTYLTNLFKDLEKQNYKNFDIIVIDQSKPFNKTFYNNFKINIKVFYQNKKGLWQARNRAIKKSDSDFILLLDDDSRINPNWITEHLKCIDYFKADISAGVSISLIGSPIPQHYSYFRWADQLDTGNVLIKKKVFKKCGLFDLQFEGMRMGDDNFGIRAYVNGFKSINNPLARRLHLKANEGGLRELGSWDGLRPVGWSRPRPVPSILYHFRQNWGDINTIFFLVKNIPLSLSHYSIKGKKIGYAISIIIFSFSFPIVLIQVLRSWSISTNKLNEGPLIDDY